MRLIATLFAALLLVVPTVADDHFEKQVRPLLTKHCLSCHGPDKQEASLRLDTKAGWRKGGAHGPAIAPSRPDESLLIKAVRGADGPKRMPPDGKLDRREVAALVKWVKDGAFDPRDGSPTRLGGTT